MPKTELRKLKVVRGTRELRCRDCGQMINDTFAIKYTEYRIADDGTVNSTREKGYSHEACDK